MLRNLNVLVTGGAGFIGSNIVEFLLDNDVETVRVLDNLSTGKEANLESLIGKHSNLEFVCGDTANLDTCRKAVQGIDVITHQAALVSVRQSVGDPLLTHESNVDGFLNILIAAKESGVKRIAYASSSAVYGNNPSSPKREEDVGDALSPYAATKAINEMYAVLFTRCYGMECIGLRYFNVFGPRQDSNGAHAAVIPKFISQMRRGEQPVINGDGSFSRDFIYVDDVVQANVLALTTDDSRCFGQAFNIGRGVDCSLLELCSVLREELNLDINPVLGPGVPGDIRHSKADLSRAKTMLGYVPTVGLKEGITKLLRTRTRLHTTYKHRK